MIVSGFQKLTLLDYPGKTACIVFTRDCNFRCPFCHNAALVTKENTPVIDEEEIFAYLQKRKNILEGVVITGGEALLSKGLADFIRRVKALGYSVKLDTNGSFPDRLRALIEEGLPDYIAMDIKDAPDAYARTAGSQDPGLLLKIKESISLIMQSGIPYEFRTTLVKGLHTEESLRGVLTLIEGAKRYYLQNFVDSGDLVDGEGLAPFSRAEMEAFAAIAREKLPFVGVRGVD